MRLFKTLSVLNKEFLAFETPDSLTVATTSKGVILLFKSATVRGDKIWEDLLSETLGESFCIDYLCEGSILDCYLMYFKPAIVSFFV